MKAAIDREGCIGCGLCADTCPVVFHMAADGLAEVHADTVPVEEEASAREAMDNCPFQSLHRITPPHPPNIGGLCFTFSLFVIR